MHYKTYKKINSDTEEKSVLAAVTSIIISIFTFLSILGTEEFDKDQIEGAIFLLAVSIIFAVVSIAKKERMRALPVIAIVISIISVFAVLGE